MRKTKLKKKILRHLTRRIGNLGLAITMYGTKTKRFGQIRCVIEELTRLKNLIEEQEG